MNTITSNNLADTLVMYQANKRAYEKQITDLSRVVNSKILSASVFFTCSEKHSSYLFSHQVLYSGHSMIPPELTDFLKLHIQALQEAVQIINKKINILAKNILINSVLKTSAGLLCLSSYKYLSNIIILL